MILAAGRDGGGHADHGRIHAEIETRFTPYAGTCPPYSEPFHSGHPPTVLERRFFTRLDREIRLARHLRDADGQEERMTCEDEDYELEDMGEGRAVLDIVRRILRDRTDWIAQGQVLMEEIMTEVEKHPAWRA